MFNYIELLKQFISTDFKLRYKNSYLGIIWIILKPLATFAVIYMIWSNIFKMDPNYKMGLLMGIMIMNMFSEGVLNGLTSLMSKAGVILKINFPREVVVISAVTISLIDFFINMIVFAIFSISTPVHPSFLGVLLFIMAILTVFLLIMGISFFSSVIYIKLRDIHNLTIVILQLIFWMTPIYYKLEMLPENLQKYIKLNPLTLIVTYARKGIIEGNAVRGGDFLELGVVLLITIFLFAVGLFFFRKKITKLAEYF